MRNFRNILLLFTRNSLRRKDKNQIVLYIILGILYISLMAFSIYLIDSFSAMFISVEAELITLILFGDFLVTVFLGTFACISFLYLSKDSEFFLSLPIKPVTVFLAKLSMVCITEILISALFLLPLLITIGIKLSLGALFFCLIPVMIISVPLFALVFIALFSMPIMFLITLFKNRGAISSIIVIAIFAIIMTLYYMAMFSASNAGASGNIDISPLLDKLESIANAFYPFYMLVKFCLHQTSFNLSLALSGLIQLLIFLGTIISASITSYILSLAFYKKINARVLEQGTTKTKQGRFSQNSPFKALLKREFKEVVRTPMLAFQVFMGTILCPIIVSMSIISITKSISSTDIPDIQELNAIINGLFWGMATMMLFMMGVGLNPGGGFSISREGQNFCYLKLIPVSYKTQIAVKHTFYTIIGFITAGLSLIAVTVIALIEDRLAWWLPPLIAVGMFSWVYALSALAIYYDLKSPKLDYKNIREITKRLKNSAVMMVWVLASMIYSIIILICCIQYVENIDIILAMGISVYSISGPIFAYIFHKKLYSNTKTLFNLQ